MWLAATSALRGRPDAGGNTRAGSLVTIGHIPMSDAPDLRVLPGVRCRDRRHRRDQRGVAQ
jgi:hypothetical protein